MTPLGSYAASGRHTDGWHRLTRTIDRLHREAGAAIEQGEDRRAYRLIVEANRLIDQRRGMS